MIDMKKLCLVVLLAYPVLVYSDCYIAWAENSSAEGVTEYRIYHNLNGAGFVLKGPAVIHGSATTCSRQGIATGEEVGNIGITAVNVARESAMLILPFPVANQPTEGAIDIF